MAVMLQKALAVDRLWLGPTKLCSEAQLLVVIETALKLSGCLA